MKTDTLELLAPARNLETARVAIDCGADAVYIGARSFGARAAAGNDIADIAELVSYAHLFGVKVYVTMNTILKDSELEDARRLALELADVGVDALIVQDMAYTTMNLPLPLHASTQCDIRTPLKGRLLAQAGFTQLVLPREFTPEQIAQVHKVAGVPVEVFIHGARCVSYSGDCQMGYAATGRSANRGACPQMCRLPFALVDGAGRPLGPVRHYLSLSDLRTDDIRALVEAGASSFKIEGRLKDKYYVANAVAWYSRQLDEFIAASGGRYRRSSFGKAVAGFEPDIDKGFFRRPNGPGRQACLLSPNDTGNPVGRVSAAYSRRTRSFKAELADELANGDGLGYFDANGVFHGFRLNRADGNSCFPATPQPDIPAGTTLFRVTDKAFEDALEKARPRRTLQVDFRLEKAGEGFTLTARSENGAESSETDNGPFQKADKPQAQQRQATLGRLGGTVFSVGEVTDCLEDVFVPLSLLAEMRRRVLDKLAEAIRGAHVRQAPGECRLGEDAFADIPPLDYHDNVSNAKARGFYSAHGARIASMAAECAAPAQCTGKRVMSTRYCIRRELGACLKGSNGAKYPDDMYLKNDSGLYRLVFDCNRCGMDIIKEK